MKKYLFITTIIISLFLLGSCDDNELLKYEGDEQTLIGFTLKEIDLKVDTDSSTDIQIEVNVSDLSSSDRTAVIAINTQLSSALPANYTLPPTTNVIIPANSYTGTFTLTGHDDDNIDFVGKNVVFDLVSIEGGEVTKAFNRTIVTIVEVCPTANQCTLTIHFDGYSEEESWDIKDSTNMIVASNSYPAGVSSTVEDVCLPDGTYTFTIYDSYGDGLYDGVTTGTYELKFGNTVFASGSGNFGSSESTTFTK